MQEPPKLHWWWVGGDPPTPFWWGGGPTTPPPLPYFQGCRFLRQKFILTASPPKLFSFARCCGSTPHHEFLFTCGGGGRHIQKNGVPAGSGREVQAGPGHRGGGGRRRHPAHDRRPERGAVQHRRLPAGKVPPFLGAGGWMCLLGDLVLFFFWAPPRGPSPLIITPPPTAARPHRFRKFGKAVYFFCTLGAVYAKFELRAFFCQFDFFFDNRHARKFQDHPCSKLKRKNFFFFCSRLCAAQFYYVPSDHHS